MLLITHGKFEKYKIILQLNIELGDILHTKRRGIRQYGSHTKDWIKLAKIYWAINKDPDEVLKHVNQAEKQYRVQLKYRKGVKARFWIIEMKEIKTIKAFLKEVKIDK